MPSPLAVPALADLTMVSVGRRSLATCPSAERDALTAHCVTARRVGGEPSPRLPVGNVGEGEYTLTLVEAGLNEPASTGAECGLEVTVVVWAGSL